MSSFGANAYAGLVKLLPTPKLATAVIIATHSDKTATVEFPGGDRERVRCYLGENTVTGGAFGAGDKVFVRDGVIEGGAPALMSSSIGVS